ncbi:hypothetical protein FRC11_004385, partial [Ceratobasidium sp. 423]
ADSHLTTLDALITQHGSTLPCLPTSAPPAPPAPSPLAQSTLSPWIKFVRSLIHSDSRVGGSGLGPSDHDYCGDRRPQSGPI